MFLKRAVKQRKEEIPDVTLYPWILEQIELLWKKRAFRSGTKLSIFDPNDFYKIPLSRDKFVFLVNQYNLPFKDIAVYTHAGLKV